MTRTISHKQILRTFKDFQRRTVLKDLGNFPLYYFVYTSKYTSKSFSVKHLLEKQDRKVFRKVSGIDRHPLRGLLPKKKVSTYNLRNRTSQYPKVNTDRFKNSYINRLIFNYDLAM